MPSVCVSKASPDLLLRDLCVWSGSVAVPVVVTPGVPVVPAAVVVMVLHSVRMVAAAFKSNVPATVAAS